MPHVQGVFKTYPPGPLRVLQGVYLHLEQASNPSFAMAFGNIAAGLDLPTQLSANSRF